MRFRIKNFSSLFFHPDYRWDSEYSCFEPHKNESLEYVPIGRILASSQYGVSIEMNEEGIGTKIYRMNEIGNMLCDRHILKYARLDAGQVSAYRLRDRDVLFNRTNSQAFVGRTGLYKRHSNEDHVFASYLVRLNPDPKTISPEYLTAFLNTTYGILDVKRRARISINQSNVNAEELKRVEIPLVSKELQARITSSFDSAFSRVQASEAKYAEAQDILLEELGLADWRPTQQLSFVKSFSDLAQAERMDADYFQPKYDDIVNSIKNYPGGWAALGNLVTIKDKNFKPKDNTQYRYIQLANISGNGEITDCTTELGKDLPSRARRQVAEGDVVVSSIEGSLSSIALIEAEYDRALCSTGFYVINSNVLNSETLLVLLKSMVGQMQLKKGCSGTILTAISKEKFRQIVLPVISEGIQDRIRQKIVESAGLRRESKRLLKCAKRSVEIAIEHDEDTALKWLNTETGKAKIHV